MIITQEKSYAVAHILKEAQRRAEQTNELMGELLEVLDLPNKPDDDAWSDVADVVYGFDTASNLFDRLEIQIETPTRKFAEEELSYSAKEGWVKSNGNHILTLAQ